MTPHQPDDQKAGYAYAPSDSPAYWNFGTYWRLLATSDTTSGRSTTFDELFPQGLVAPPHVHDDAEEAFFVLEGDLVFTLGDDDREITAPPGTYVYIPPGTRHSFRCDATVGRVYNTLVPGGFDHGITEHGTPAPQVQMPPPGTSAIDVWESRSSPAAQRCRGSSRPTTCRSGDPAVVLWSAADMSLTFGPGPFSADRAGLLSAGDLPRTTAYAEPYPRRVRAFLDGRAVLDSERGWILHAQGQAPELWFPAGDLDTAALPTSALQDFAAGQDPVAEALAGFRSLAPDAVDRWFIEDEPVYAHVRDPYHRVDVLASHRHVLVEHAGTIVADTTRPKMLFETGLPPRFYIPWADVRPGLLELSDTVSECPYKGDGQHWHLRTPGEHVADAAWSLPHPLPEGIPAAEQVSFYPDLVTVTVDGQRLRQ